MYLKLSEVQLIVHVAPLLGMIQMYVAPLLRMILAERLYTSRTLRAAAFQRISARCLRRHLKGVGIRLKVAEDGADIALITKADGLRTLERFQQLCLSLQL